MSSCFFSSRLKMRISAMSVCRKRSSTALPNEPVPPVIKSVLFLNILGSPSSFSSSIHSRLTRFLSLGVQLPVILPHRLHQLRPSGRDIPRRGPEPGGVEGPIAAEIAVRLDVDPFAIALRHQLEQVVLGNRSRGYLVHPVKRGIGDDVVGDNPDDLHR